MAVLIPYGQVTNPDNDLCSIYTCGGLCLHNAMLKDIYKYIMKFIVWIINDIHMEFNDIHWEGCLHITRRRMKALV